MGSSESKLEIFLQPGDFYFGDRDTRIRTLLGSCVSITAWHPEKRIGGMCHYMLPTRRMGKIVQLDGRYGEEAVLWFFREASSHATDPKDYEIKIFGGGDMFNSLRTEKDGIGRLNALLGLGMLQSLGHRITAQHVGGSGHRTVIFDVESGEVWLRHVPLSKTLEKALA